MLLASVILVSCQKTDSLSNNTNTNSLVGNWYITENKSYTSDYYGGSFSESHKSDSLYLPPNQVVFSFLNTNSLLYINQNDTIALPYKVLDNTHTVIDFSSLDDTSYNVYLIDTFNYKFNGNNLTLWYNREVLYKTVSNGYDPQFVSYSDIAYPTNYDISNPTYHSIQADTFNLVKQ